MTDSLFSLIFFLKFFLIFILSFLFGRSLVAENQYALDRDHYSQGKVSKSGSNGSFVLTRIFGCRSTQGSWVAMETTHFQSRISESSRYPGDHLVLLRNHF